MPIFINGAYRNCIVAVYLLLLLCPAGNSEESRRDYPVIAREIVRSVYPSLSHNAELVYTDSSSWSDSSPMNIFLLDVYESSRCCSSGSPLAGVKSTEVSVHQSRRQKSSIEAEFRFSVSPSSASRPLFDMQVFGPHVRKRLNDFLKQVEAHPKWSESRIIQELKKVGARFGPEDKAALLASVPLEQLRPFIGQTEVSSAEFVAQDLRKQISQLLWRVVVVTKDQQPVRRYVLDFEPFDGRLLSLTRE